MVFHMYLLGLPFHMSHGATYGTLMQNVVQKKRIAHRLAAPTFLLSTPAPAIMAYAQTWTHERE